MTPDLPDKAKAGDHGQTTISDAKDEDVLPTQSGNSDERNHHGESESVDVTSTAPPPPEPEPETAAANELIEPEPETPLPTPRPSSPLRIAIDSIHSTKPDEDSHPTSPTERKEESVQPPTKVCAFPPISQAEEHERHVEGNFL